VSPSLEQRLRRDNSFERLYRQHRRDVYGAVLRDVRDPAEAEDVTQIAFLNAFRAIRRGEEPEKPRAWLVTIAQNVCRRRYRDLARRPQEVGLDPEVAVAVAEVDGPTAGEIAAAIRRLPENQRAVILLREIQGHSYMEIAAELDLSVSAVETLIFRARRNLSEQLELSEHAPVTLKRRVRGWLALPLPGFGSFSFSLGRAGVAAMIGGVAIVTAPMGSSPSLTTSPRAPSAAEAAGPAIARTHDHQLRSSATVETQSPLLGQHRPATGTSGGTGGKAAGGAGALPQVAVPSAGPLAAVPSVDPLAAVPSVDTLAPVPIPSLPVQPALPPPPAVPPLPSPLG
jgi:RNA polymerase sigma factor (sigma-70 family)